MATDAGGTRPLTQFVAGNGQSTVDYQLPAGLFQYIQSVVATVDTSASGDVSPLLTIRDDAGIVVADKQQGQAVDAGGAGRATWALRLTDEQAAITALARPWGFYTIEPLAGNPVASGTQSTYMRPTFAGGGAGVDVLNVFSVPLAATWTVKKPGVYCFMARLGLTPSPFVPWPAGSAVCLDLAPQGADPPPANSWATEATVTAPLVNGAGSGQITIYAMRYMTPAEVSTGGNWSLNVAWNYVGDVTVDGFLEAIRIG